MKRPHDETGVWVRITDFGDNQFEGVIENDLLHVNLKRGFKVQVRHPQNGHGSVPRQGLFVNSENAKSIEVLGVMGGPK
jgi:hypothetical protein